jgi:hypothetical protein
MRITIFNFTDYITSNFRHIIKRCCKELYIKQDKIITIEFGKKEWIHGEAYLGSRIKENSIINIWVPMDEVNSVDFARLVKHELMHNLGVKHSEMTIEQKKCSRGSEWAAYYPINKYKISY